MTAGFGARLLERLLIGSGKKSKLEFNVYPARQLSTTVVEPSNCTLATFGMVDHSGCAVIVTMGHCAMSPATVLTVHRASGLKIGGNFRHFGDSLLFYSGLCA
jgi:hypothetical protein